MQCTKPARARKGASTPARAEVPECPLCRGPMVRVRTHKEQPWIAACVWCNELPDGVEVERTKRKASDEAEPLALIAEFAATLRAFLERAREHAEPHHGTCCCPVCTLSKHLWPVYASVAQPEWMARLLRRLRPMTAAEWRAVKLLYAK